MIAWLRKANDALRAVVVLRGRPELPAEMACFHYQQAVEKALKGLLTTSGIENVTRNHERATGLQGARRHGDVFPRLGYIPPNEPR